MIAVLLVMTMAWLVGGFTLFLHYLSRQYGALPLSFFVAAVVAMLDIFEFAPFFIIPTEGVVFIITSDVLIPSTLLAILVLYVVNGTRPAQLAILGIIAVGLLVYVVVLTLWATTHLLDPHQLDGSLAQPGAISWSILGRMAVGRLAFLADMLMIVIVFQALYNISPGFERLTGYSRDSVFRRPATMLKMIHPDDRSRYAMPFLDYVQENPEDEFRIVRTDGEVRWVRSRVFLIHDHAGALVRIGGMVEDITQQKSDQDRQFALALEQEKVRLLENFIRDASHDLRTPISALAMSLHILKTSPDVAMRQRHLESLENRVNYLNRLIDNLFTLTKVESGGSAEFQPLSLEQLLRDTITHLLPLAAEKGLQVVQDMSDNLPLMWGDPVQLERAFSNLIENAIRYTMSGSITIRTRYEANQQLYLEISDTGIGIAPEDMPRLFDRFYRAPSAAKHRIQGTGLGLAIIKSVVERHRGTVAVQSTLNVGTVFQVRFPPYAPVLQPLDVLGVGSS